MPWVAPPTVQYYWNDIASHRMTVTRWEAWQPDQPIAFTNYVRRVPRRAPSEPPTP